MKRLSEDRVLLCGKGKCCPVITKIDEETYEVKDDDGNVITVKKHELEMVSDAVKELDKPEDRDVICG
jgi:preprotein translocase subunit YajC